MNRGLVTLTGSGESDRRDGDTVKHSTGMRDRTGTVLAGSGSSHSLHPPAADAARSTGPKESAFGRELGLSTHEQARDRVPQRRRPIMAAALSLSAARAFARGTQIGGETTSTVGVLARTGRCNAA